MQACVCAGIIVCVCVQASAVVCAGINVCVQASECVCVCVSVRVGGSAGKQRYDPRECVPHADISE